MKKTLLILAISALTLSLNAYVPMLQNGKTWTRFRINMSTMSDYYTTTDSILSDTVVNGQTYNMANFTKVLLREDTVAQRIYAFDPNRGYEEMIFDFSLNVGDSLLVYCSDKIHDALAHVPDKEHHCRIFVTKIDTVLSENDIPLRRFTYETVGRDLQTLISGTFVEGYGNIGDNMTMTIDKKYAVGHDGGTLRCVTEPDGTLLYYGHSAQMDKYLGDDCAGSGKIPDAVENTPSSQVSIAYSNNTLSINAENIDNVEIFTATGVMIGGYSSSEITLSLTPGIYFARIAADGRVSTERFIVK